jgi:hypothetical protein
MNRFALALLGPGLVACAAKGAPAPSAPKPPALDPALKSLEFYVGSWSCKGTNYAADGKVEKTWEARLEVVPVLDGKWLSVQMIGPGMNRSAEHKGYDAEKKRWVHVYVGNDGGWGTMTSDGWTGSSMVFLDPEDASGYAKFTKIDERTYSHGVTVKTEQGGERKAWEKVCTKM